MADGDKLEQLRRARLAFDCVSGTMYFGPRLRVLMLDNPKLQKAFEDLSSELIKYPELFRGDAEYAKAHEEYCLAFGKLDDDDELEEDLKHLEILNG